LPISNAPGYDEKPVLVIQGMEQLDALIAQVGAEDLDTFCLVTFDNNLIHALLSQVRQGSVALRPLRWISIGGMQFVCAAISQ